MERPFAVIGFTLLLSTLVASVFGTVPTLILGGVLFFCFLLSFLIQQKQARRYFLCVLLSAVTGLSVFTAYTHFRVAPVQLLAGCSALVEGVLTEPAGFSGSRYTYHLETNSVELPDAPQKIKIVLTSKEEIPMALNDRVKVNAAFSTSSNSGDYAKGFFLSARALGRAEITSPDSYSLTALVAAQREKMKNTIQNYLPGQEGAIIRSMVLADNSGMDYAVSDAFRQSGVSHLFAVSGLHVTLWSGAVYMLLRKLRLGLKPASVAAAGFTLFYMALTGFSMSVLRAGIMMIVMLLGRAFLKTADGLNSLGLAAGLLCLMFPMAVTSVSFLLTVSACLGIFTLGKYLLAKSTNAFKHLRFGKALNWLAGGVLLSFSIMVFTFPVQLIYFKEFVPLSLISNLIFIPFGSATIAAGGIAAFFGFLPFISAPAAFLAGLGAKAMLFFARAFAQFPITAVGIGEPWLILCTAGCLLLFAVAFLFNKRKRMLKTAAVLCAALIIVSALTQTALTRNLMNITVLDTGGVSVLFTYRGSSVLVGCGKYRTASAVQSALTANHQKELDLLVLPVIDKDDGNLTAALAELVPVRQVVMPENTLNTLPAEKITADSNVAIDFPSGFRVEYRYENNHFAVRVSFGQASVLLTDRAGVALFGEDAAQNAQIHISEALFPEQDTGGLQVLCGDNYAMEKALLRHESGSNIAATGGYGDLNIQLNENGSYNVRRVSEWPQLAKQN